MSIILLSNLHICCVPSTAFNIDIINNRYLNDMHWIT